MIWNRLRFVLLLAGLLLASCGDDRSSSSSSPEEETKGEMILVSDKDKSVTLGTDESSAKQMERPQMKVELTYDFYISKHEVTCGEFNRLNESNDSRKCRSANVPVSGVTFYDVVLFANARSKSENLDTVYTYTGKSYGAEGRCVGLDGYTFHPEKNGYRLPTEAEWVYVASRGWENTDSWNSENSGFEKHSVCTKNVNDLGVCDMAGNVKEWVNDWMGYFKDTTVTNYVGAPDGGGVGERVLKGGSFRDSSSQMHLFSRSDIYTVTSATVAEYVGFRLARGAIQAATWMNRNGNVAESPVFAMASSAELTKKTKNRRNKLVFRNDVTGNLNFVDYSNANLTTVEIQDTLEVYHPVISPDGNRVAFSTMPEGVSGKSSLYVRNLDATGSGLVKLDVESAAIPRWKVVNGDTVIVYVSDAGVNTEDSEFKSMSTWQVSFADGQFGTPKKLFDGNYHGGISDDNRLAVTGARKLRARIAEPGESLTSSAVDTLWYDGEQACNVSMFMDGSKRTSFLDFRGKPGVDFVGSSYRVHERLLIADSVGKLIQSVGAPQGYAFDHSEWVSGDLVIASLTNADGAHRKIVLVDLGDSSVTDLLEGEELWQPDLWVKNRDISQMESTLDLDSAGIYYTEKSSFAAYELRMKMESFWVDPEKYTAVSLGSSRMLFGVDSREMEKTPLLNFGYSGGDFFGSHYLLKNYALNHMKNLKYVVLEVTPNMFWRSKDTDWSRIYEGNPGYLYDEHHQFWRDGVPDFFVETVQEGPSFQNKETLPYRDEFTLNSKSWGDPEMLNDSTYSPYDAPIVEENFELLRDMVSMAKAADLKVVVLIFPIHPGYDKLKYFGPFGPPYSLAEKLLDRVAALDVVVMDENKWGKHDYTDEMAFDSDHLSFLGAIQLSHRLDSLLQKL